jgi:hypothetical protein
MLMTKRPLPATPGEATDICSTESAEILVEIIRPPMGRDRIKVRDAKPDVIKGALPSTETLLLIRVAGKRFRQLFQGRPLSLNSNETFHCRRHEHEESGTQISIEDVHG